VSIPDYDVSIIAKLLSGATLNGELGAVSKPFKPLAELLNVTPACDRRTARDAFLCAPGVDREGLLNALAKKDPTAPLPEIVDRPARRAHLGDVRKLMTGEQWLWPGWIASGRLLGISGLEGLGKTRLAMDLARRIWLAEDWPDKKPPSFPAGTPTLWLCSDGQQEELVTTAESFGMPEDSVFFNAPPDAPYDNTTIDGAEAVAWLEESIQLVRPGLVFIDSLTYATSLDLCQAKDVKNLMTPIRDIAQRTRTAICSLLHVSRDGHALGKRIKGLTRTILQLECPDPEESSRLKLSVAKSFAKKPPALGVTIGERQNTYDSNPPTAPAATEIGRPPAERAKAKKFIREAMEKAHDRVGTELTADWKKMGGSNDTLKRAIKEMVTAKELDESGGPGTGGQWTLHLHPTDLDPNHNF